MFIVAFSYCYSFVLLLKGKTKKSTCTHIVILLSQSPFELCLYNSLLHNRMCGFTQKNTVQEKHHMDRCNYLTRGVLLFRLYIQPPGIKSIFYTRSLAGTLVLPAFILTAFG